MNNKIIHCENIDVTKITIKEMFTTEFFLVSLIMLDFLNGFVGEILKFWNINAPTSFVYIIIYLMASIIWLRVLIRQPRYCLSILGLYVCLLILTVLMFPLNAKIIFNIGNGTATDIAQSNFMRMTVLCLPLLIGIKICTNLDFIKNCLFFYSKIIVLLFLCTMVLSIFVYPGKINYMSIAYNVLPALFFVYYRRKIYQKKIDLLLIVLGFIGLLFGGCRGAILTFAVFVLIYEISYFKKENGIGQFLRLIIVPLIVLLVSLNFIAIIEWLDSFLQSFGYRGRLFAKILGDSADGDFFQYSDRQEILDAIIPNIGLIGKGIFADQVIAGIYAHNIVVEILVEFGLIIGPVIILAFVFFVFNKYTYAKKSKDEFELFCVYALIAITCIKLMFSATYLTDRTFWLFLGLTGVIKGKLNALKIRL